MQASVAESTIPQASQAQAALRVANKPPQLPVSQENGEQFAKPDAERAGISRVDTTAEKRISRHEVPGGGELIGAWKKTAVSGTAQRATSAVVTCQWAQWAYAHRSPLSGLTPTARRSVGLRPPLAGGGPL
jgi:hypothetical protein